MESLSLGLVDEDESVEIFGALKEVDFDVELVRWLDIVKSVVCTEESDRDILQ